MAQRHQTVSSDAGDLLIRSTGLHLRIKRQEPPALHISDPPVAPRPNTDTSAPAAAEELQTIRLAAGGRGAGLEALRQRSQSAPQKRQVKVTLLNSHDAPAALTISPQDYSSHDATGANRSCDMERVTELTESVQRLLLHCRGQTLTEEALHRLETLHNQQLTLQNQLLDSALKFVLRPQAPPPAAVAMETLPFCQGGATDSVSTAERSAAAVSRPTANERPEEAGLRPEQVLMEMNRLRTELQSVLTQRDEAESGPEPRSAQPRPEPRPSRAFQDKTRPHKVPLHSDPGTVRRLHHKKSRNLPITPTKGRKHQMQQLRDAEATEKHLNISRNQEQDREDTPQQQQDSYIQYLQNRVKSRHNDFQKLTNEMETGEKSSKESDCEGEKETRTDGGEEEQQDQLKEQKNQDFGDSQDKENTICYKPGLGLQGSRTSQGLLQDPEILEGPSAGLQGLKFSADLGQGSSRDLRSGLQGPRTLGPDGPDSVLDQARQVLKKVQRRKKVLEENLESQLRVRSEELLLCHINALEQNRDCSNEIRIKKTVDSLIRDIQAEMKLQPQISQASAKSNTAQRRDPAPSANRSTAQRRDPAPSASRSTAQRDPAPSANRSTAQRRDPAPSANRIASERRNFAPSARPLKTTSKPIKQPIDLVLDPVPDPVLDSEERLRHVYGKAAHEGQRRSLKRSPYLRLNSPVSPERHRPRPHVLQSVRGVKLKSCKTQTQGPSLGLNPGISPGLGISPILAVSPGSVQSGAGFPAVAVPLGRPRTGPSHSATQQVTSPPTAPPLPPPQEVTSPPRTPPSIPLPPQEVTSEDTKAQQSSDPPMVHILQASPQQEEEEATFPGTHFLSVADVEQSEAGSEAGLDDSSNQELELEGSASPDLVEYQGPHFPPQAPSLPSAQDQSLSLGCELQRDVLEQRLVQWVEQQLMSRIICDMLRPLPSDPTHSPYTSQSDAQQRPESAQPLPTVQSEPSAAHACGGSSLQLHVDSGQDLDEDQVRGLVLEVLTETVALFLGTRETLDSQTEPDLGPDPEPEPGLGTDTGPTQIQQTLVPTPEPTPPQTPPTKAQTPPPAAQTPPLSPVATPIATPPLTDLPSAKEDPPSELVATPPPTPPVTCADAEPLLVEEPEAPPPHEPSPAPSVVAPPPGPPSPPDSVSSSSSSSSSEDGVTAPRQMSEGEVLLRQRHLQVLHEDTSSFSSSLHELQEMEFDPPSEGQVHNSILLNFINKLQQREPRPPPEGSWGRGLEEEEEVSAGEIRDVIHQNVTNQSRSLSQTSPVADFLEQTNQSALSEGLLTSDLLDTPPAQVHAADSALKQSSDLDLDLDLDRGSIQTHQTQRSQDPALDLNRELHRPERNGVGGAEAGAEGAVWGEGNAALVKMDVFVPMVETAETSGGSESFSDAF